ncbi:hypothetical protein WN944_011082 [Citrus x changshan-huyou]|uniref:Uncharacterized protein n=1 Tax=Citrus x changshan-huyou TaxID=2935761 RepID=A0AAP0MSU5_9ROSI
MRSLEILNFGSKWAVANGFLVEGMSMFLCFALLLDFTFTDLVALHSRLLVIVVLWKSSRSFLQRIVEIMTSV